MAVNDLVEAQRAESLWSPARVVHLRPRGATGKAAVTVIYQEPAAPARAWTYLARDSEVLGKVLRSHYEPWYGRSATTNMLPAILALQQPKLQNASARMRALTQVLLPEIHLALDNEQPRSIAKAYNCAEKDLVELNRLASGLKELTAGCKLKRHWPIVLPPCWRAEGANPC